MHLNKHIPCGFMVLENAKCIMGNFWYNVLKPLYKDQIKLILSDTDSFTYAVHTEDSYTDMYKMNECMDLSGYNEKTSPGNYNSPENKKVPGKFSDDKPVKLSKNLSLSSLKWTHWRPSHLCARDPIKLVTLVQNLALKDTLPVCHCQRCIQGS